MNPESTFEKNKKAHREFRVKRLKQLRIILVLVLLVSIATIIVNSYILIANNQTLTTVIITFGMVFAFFISKTLAKVQRELKWWKKQSPVLT